MTDFYSPQKLHAEIEAFCAKHKMNASTFGKLALKNSSLASRLKNGNNLTLKSINRVYRFMAEYEQGERKGDGGTSCDAA